jgi:hypothetical protein
VRTIAHDELGNPSKPLRKTREKKLRNGKIVIKSFCALVLTNAQKELRQRSGYFGENSGFSRTIARDFGAARTAHAHRTLRVWKPCPPNLYAHRVSRRSRASTPSAPQCAPLFRITHLFL